MKRLASFCLVLASTACIGTPPAQVVEPLPTIPDAPAGSATAVPADIGASLDPGTPPPPAEPFQSVLGTLGGKPWELKGAGTAGPVQKDGSVVITLGNYLIDCSAHVAGPDDRTITLTIPWKAHAKVELATLKATEAAATFIDEKKKKATPVKGWKPKGTVEVMGAPTGAKSSGRIKIELTSGNDAITAEVPVKLCFAN